MAPTDRLFSLFLSLLALTCTAMAAPASANNQTKSPEAYAKRDYFYAGGSYVQGDSIANGTVRTGQIYVERLTPQGGVRHKYPLVFWHGGVQTGTNWLNTPDGRMGWASYFLQCGYQVYLIDQPERGRSFWELSDGEPLYNTVEKCEAVFTAPQDFNLYPLAKYHTQWPGTGKRGDPTFDAFFASQVGQQKNASRSEQLNRDAGAALFDIIGDAILVTHSQSGPYGWGIGELRPDKVKGILAIEPSGPPFTNEGMFGNNPARPYGLTILPLAYDPPISSPSELKTVTNPPPNTNLSSCTIQADPPRRLVNLSKVPVMMITSEASYHAAYDYCTVEYLKQAGVDVNWVHLPDRGIFGNGHFIFMEKNNLEVAPIAEEWFGSLSPRT